MRLRIALAFIVGWALPGGGDLLLGRRRRGLLLFLGLSLFFAAGVVLSDFRVARFDDDPFVRSATFGCGLFAAVAGWVLPNAPAGRVPLACHDVGLLYTALAGLANAIVILSLVPRHEGTPDGEAR